MEVLFHEIKTKYLHIFTNLFICLYHFSPTNHYHHYFTTTATANTMQPIYCAFVSRKIPRRGARKFAKLHVANSHHVPMRGIWWYCTQHLLWTRYNAYMWHGGKYFDKRNKSKKISQKCATKERKPNRDTFFQTMVDYLWTINLNLNVGYTYM